MVGRACPVARFGQTRRRTRGATADGRRGLATGTRLKPYRHCHVYNPTTDRTHPITTPPPLLSVSALTCFRGDRLVLRDISFTLPAGAALLLTGANGAGKSTLLRLLAGLRTPDGGSIHWNGTPITDDAPAHAARCGMIGEHNALKPGLTATENLRFAAAGRPIPPALHAFGLTALADLPTRMLSAGQRRRLALARLLVSDTRLWLLDEPTLGLDTASVAQLGETLATHRATGGLVVAATHLALPLPDAQTLRLGA